MEVYKHWVRRNREFIQSLESLANGITWLLRKRFSNYEIGPEAGTHIHFAPSLRMRRGGLDISITPHGSLPLKGQSTANGD